MLDVKIHRWGKNPAIDMQYDREDETFPFDGYVMAGDSTIYIVKADKENLLHLLDHETLHVVLDRIDLVAESTRFDWRKPRGEECGGICGEACL